MTKLVTLDGQVLHGRDRYGLWKINTMEGWDETPPEKTSSEAKALADGDYDAEVFYGPRLVTLNGRLSASTPGDAFTARERLTALLRVPGEFVVQQHGLARAGMARRGRINPGQIRGRHLPFQIEARFIDPYKYGEEHVFTGTSVSVFHRGTAPAWPVVTVTGASATGYTITLAGKTVTVPQPLTSGTPHTIDYRTGILRVGGGVAKGGLGAVNLSPVQPGMPQTMSISAGTLSARFRDTFI